MREGRQADWLRAIKGRRRAGAAVPTSSRAQPEQSPALRGRITRTGIARSLMTELTLFVGIDVSKAHLDVALRPSGTDFRVANDPVGLADLVARLAPLSPALVVL